MAARKGLTELMDLTGSGDNVLVRAWMTYEHDLDAHKPFQKGLLRDSSMGSDDVRPFVVYDPNVRLEPGTLYLLNGADHYYAPSGEVQLRLDEGAYVEELRSDTS